MGPRPEPTPLTCSCTPNRSQVSCSQGSSTEVKDFPMPGPFCHHCQPEANPNAPWKPPYQQGRVSHSSLKMLSPGPRCLKVLPVNERSRYAWCSYSFARCWRQMVSKAEWCLVSWNPQLRETRCWGKKQAWK